MPKKKSLQKKGPNMQNMRFWRSLFECNLARTSFSLGNGQAHWISRNYIICKSLGCHDPRQKDTGGGEKTWQDSAIPEQ